MLILASTKQFGEQLCSAYKLPVINSVHLPRVKKKCVGVFTQDFGHDIKLFHSFT